MAYLRGSAFNVDINSNGSLDELAWGSGRLVAFDNNDSEMPVPFLLAIAEGLAKGFDNYYGIKLLFKPDKGTREEWTLRTRGEALVLWTPEQRGGRTFPKWGIAAQGGVQENPYFVEYAYSEKDSILHALDRRKGQGLDYYATCIRAGKLNTERGRIGKLIERCGFDSLLPNQLRFK